MKAKLILTLTALIAGSYAEAQYIEELTKKPVYQASSIDQSVQAHMQHGQVQQFLADKKGEWVLNATVTNTYATDGRLQSKLYIPTAFNKT